jgi:ferredoxin
VPSGTFAEVGDRAVRVRIDAGRCQGHGRCVLIAPDYFDVDGTGFGRVLLETVAEADLADLREAQHCCPEGAIRLMKD